MFSSISIRAKLSGAFSILVLIILTLGGIGLNGLGTLNGSLTELKGNALPSVQWASELNTATTNYRSGLLQHLLADAPERKREMDALVDRRETKESKFNRHSPEARRF